MTPQFEERVVGDLRIRIDRTLCVSFGDCVDEAEGAFTLDRDGVAVFVKPETVDRDRLVRACEACPVDALTVLDSAGNQLVP
ncbi:MAG: ferredoxin [Gemmatimonadales bacterium]